MIRTAGFTLMEVLVASAVLSIGAAALGSVYVNFNSQRRLEIQAVDAYVCSVSAMEQILQNPPACGKARTLNVTGQTNRPCGETPILLTPVPGVSSLTVAAIQMPHGHSLQRLMRCK